MSVTISISRLKNNLAEAEEIKDFPHPQNLLKDSTEGLKYLFEKVYLDLLIDKMLRTSNLDYDAFEIDDIYDLYEFCRDNCTHANSKEMGALWKIYDDCLYSQPLKKLVSFV